MVAGAIVREISPGVFDIHLRGFDAVPPAQLLHYQQGRLTLVMIDGRIVYDHIYGATFWEAIGLGIDDVESIEVVRGPAAALYGPNAVTGVINIITRRPQGEGFHAVAKTSVGTVPRSQTRALNTAIGHVSGEYSVGRFSARLAANLQQRRRHRTSYRSVSTNDTFARPEEITFFSGQSLSEVTDPHDAYPTPAVAMRSASVRVSLYYTPDSDTSLDGSAGWQSSGAHSFRTDTQAATLSFTRLRNVYVHARGQRGDGVVRFDYSTIRSTSGIGSVTDGSIYQWTLAVEYDFEISGFDFRPELYTTALSCDGGFLARRETQAQYAASLQAETVRGAFRFIGGGRLEQLSDSARINVPYQLAVTYEPTPRDIVRVVWARAFSSASLVELRQDTLFEGVVPIPTRVLGSSGLALRKVDAVEVGYRGAFAGGVFADLELFAARLSDVPTLRHAGIIDGEAVQQYAATDVTARQVGASLSVTLRRDTAEVRLFGTLQRSELTGVLDSYIIPGGGSLKSGRARSTPTVYGGFVGSWGVIEPLHLNVSGYATTAQSFSHPLNSPGVSVASKVVLNAAASLRVTDEYMAMLTVRNVLGHDAYEFFRTDPVMTTIVLSLGAEM